MISEPFAFGDSAIHRLDPRLRVVLATAYSTVVAVADRMPVLACALGVSLILAGLARLDPVAAGKRLLAVSGFLLLLWMVLPLTTEGDPVFALGPFTASREGIWLAAQISLKSIAIVLAFMALIATMTFAALGHALNRLHLPDKLVFLLLMAYRYIFVIAQEYQRLYRAALIRGFRPKTNLHTYKTYAYLIGMLFVRAADRAERVFRAMRCRGFNGSFHALRQVSPNRTNWAYGTAMTAAIAALIALEWFPP
ncbi:MAG: cobalt ECF transporter T component CbiQ [Desulfobacterales bacterium]|nr:cobalt ECF transporter T component CbiQ [Desulfobacterales bacterium]